MKKAFMMNIKSFQNSMLKTIYLPIGIQLILKTRLIMAKNLLGNVKIDHTVKRPDQKYT